MKTSKLRFKAIQIENIKNFEEKTLLLSPPVLRSSMSHQKARNKIPCSLANIETAVSKVSKENLAESPRGERGDQAMRSREETRNKEVYSRSALEN